MMGRWRRAAAAAADAVGDDGEVGDAFGCELAPVSACAAVFVSSACDAIVTSGVCLCVGWLGRRSRPSLLALSGFALDARRDECCALFLIRFADRQECYGLGVAVKWRKGGDVELLWFVLRS
jgi:hypothetical protein